MKARVPALLALFGLVAALAAFAHPHVFINNKMTVLFGDGVLKGMTFRWAFDDMFSEMILTDFKPNADGNFSAKQTATIKAGAFDNLENYHYFLAFFVGEKRLKKIPNRAVQPQRRGGRQAGLFVLRPARRPCHGGRTSGAGHRL